MSCEDEFFDLDECWIPVLPVQIFEGILLVGLSTVLVVMSLMMIDYCRVKRPISNLSLMIWMMIHVPIASLRSIFHLLGIRSLDSLVANLAVNGAAASASGLAIFYMYLEMTILIKGSLSAKDHSMRSTRSAMVVITIVQALVFLSLPIILRWIDPSLLHAGFWLPAVVVNLVETVYFGILGVSIHRRLTRSPLPIAQTIARKLSVFLVTNLTLGTVSGISGLVAFFVRDLAWILIRVCWLSVALFDFMMFYSLASHRTRSTSSSTSISSPNTSR